MPTNRKPDDDLIAQAIRLGGHATQKAAVTAALTEYVQRRKQRQREIISLFGTINYDPGYDYKQQRAKN